MRFHFEKVVQNFKLKMIGGALKGNQLTPLFHTKHEQILGQAGLGSTKNLNCYFSFL